MEKLVESTRSSFVEPLKTQLRKEGYQVSDTPYENVRQKIDIICPKGHKLSMMWQNLKRGRRCKYCRWEEKKINFDTIQKGFAAEGYRVVENNLNTSDVQATTILSVLCPEGHMCDKMSWSRFKDQKIRCKECFLDKKRNSQKKVEASFSQEGYTLLTAYAGRTQKLKVICNNGHDWFVQWNDWLAGVRCKECKPLSNRRYTMDDIAAAFSREGYTLINPPEEYLRHSQKFEYKCPNGHRGKIVWNAWHQGHRCGKCTNQQSKGEKELVFLFSHLNLKERDRTVLKPKELDLYFPDHKVAIEYCGLYWHGEIAPGDRVGPDYHRNKLDLCKGKGIRLLTIFEDEWLSNKEICLSRIDNALGITKNKIYARKCQVKEIAKDQAKRFLKKTHLQGYGACKVAYGLFYNDELVQVMTFGSPARAHTAKKKRVLEMKRLAAALDTIIIGGASKLLKAGLKYAKDNSYDMIKSYCDLRWGNGLLYETLGFTKTYETDYTPHYTDGANRWRNQSLAQNKKKTGKTEAQMAQEKGVWKIYDCGHSTWELMLS